MTERLRVLIVDDEPLARKLVRLLLEADPEVVVAGECSGVDGVAEVARALPDILFLDVQMPEVDGFDLLERLGAEQTPVVVFVTAYDRYAVRAFEVHAVDYLLKPLDNSRFAEALAARRPGPARAAVARWTMAWRPSCTTVRATPGASWFGPTRRRWS